MVTRDTVAPGKLPEWQHKPGLKFSQPELKKESKNKEMYTSGRVQVMSWDLCL